MADAIGPRQVCRLTCNGCPALKTEDWTEYPDGERDSGTAARCSAAGDKAIGAYWHESYAVPEWCPAGVAAAPAPSLDLDRVLHLADVHAEESREDGCRVFDRGGLKAFADDCVRIATAGVKAADPLRDALIALLKWAEEAEELIEGDRGVGRSLAELEREGKISAEIVQARAALNAGVKEVPRG